MMECKADCLFNIDGKCTKQSKENMTSLEEWKNDFKGFINELSMPKDDYNGIMEYIDEVPNEPKWIPVSERLPENAKHKGAFCPKYYVMTEFGQTEGWYNPDVGCWYVLLWFMDARFETWNISLERGDVPKLVKNVPVTAWMQLPKPYKAERGMRDADSN